jgi:5-phospho-D-xylono-1,4-lactonase
LFIADIEDGIDEHDYSGPVVRRPTHRVGVIKVAGSDGGPSDWDRRVFEAAAIAHRRTGAPILNHCEGGTGAIEQLRCLGDGGVAVDHVALSHVDKVVDRGYHRELAATGASLEYDGAFRWGSEPNGTLQLLEWAAEDGHLDRVVLGMDAARRSYYAVYGGSPGLRWLLEGFSTAMEEHGLGADVRRRLFVDNAARVFSFASIDRGSAA